MTRTSAADWGRKEGCRDFCGQGIIARGTRLRSSGRTGPFMARTGHGAMSALSLLSGVKRKSGLRAVRSVVDLNSDIGPDQLLRTGWAHFLTPPLVAKW